MVPEEIGQDHLENLPVYLILLVEWKAYRECAKCKLKGECYRCDECGKFWHLGSLRYKFRQEGLLFCQDCKEQTFAKSFFYPAQDD